MHHKNDHLIIIKLKVFRGCATKSITSLNGVTQNWAHSLRFAVAIMVKKTYRDWYTFDFQYGIALTS